MNVDELRPGDLIIDRDGVKGLISKGVSHDSETWTLTTLEKCPITNYPAGRSFETDSIYLKGCTKLNINLCDRFKDIPKK